MRTVLLCACAVLAACTHVTTYPETDGGPPWIPPPLPDGGPGPITPIAVTLPEAPIVATRPAIAGGTLAVTEAGLIVAGDPDRASIWVLDPTIPALRGRIALDPTDEPGRMAVDAEGRVHVVLRRAGAVLSLDPETATAIETRAVCAAPRGIAWDASAEHLWIACAGGELLALPPSRSPVARVFQLDDDLRDVLVGDGRLYVSRFRSAELLEVDPSTGTVLARRRPPARTRDIFMMREPTTATAEANTAWRIQLDGEGDVVMLHQSSISTPIEVEMSGYSGDGCGGGVVGPAISVFEAGGTVRGGGTVSSAVLAVDLAVANRTGQFYVAAAATDALGTFFGMGTLVVPQVFADEPCIGAEAVDPSRLPRSVSAVAELPDGQRVSLSLEPLLVTVGDGIEFRADPQAVDRGYALFHTATPSMTACASCHPEGGEDGHVWDFVGTGVRRTQTLLGGILETAPFHWSGDQADMSAIMMGGFMQRMGGSSTPDEARLIGEYLDALPLPARPAVDPDQAERGRAHFVDATAGCASCHAGAAFTDNATVDVGTGGAFQVPSLRGVGLRAPYFHSGCAESLEALVAGTCGSTHTQTAHLDEVQREELVAFLRSL